MTDAYLHIDDYIADKLTASQRLAFEEAMLVDSELRLLVQHYEEVKVASADLLEVELRQTMDDLQVEDRGNDQPTNSKPGKWIVLALVVAGLLTLGYYLSREQQQSPEQYLAQNYSRATIDLERSGDTTALSTRQRADYAYASEDLEAAAQLYYAALGEATSATDSSAVYLMIGRTYLEMGEYEEAIAELKRSSLEEAASISAIAKHMRGY
jgi:tetratricopeptide (TPR) repeat protein